MQREARPNEDVLTPAQCDRSALENGYIVLNADLGLPAEPMTPDGFVPRFASELDVPDRVRHRALELAARAEETGIANGTQPSAVAAACLYAAARDHGVFLEQNEFV